MSLDRIIELTNRKAPTELERNRDDLLKLFNSLGAESDEAYWLLEKVFRVARITSNHRTRASFIRSYYRTYLNDIDKDGRGSSVIIEITKRCNKGCQYCYSQPGKNIDMETTTLNQIIEFARTNYKHIFITGGEPTLDKRVLTICRANPDIMFFMFTNGSLIDENYAERIVELGNLIPILSIDGSFELMHDGIMKGKGNFRQVMKAIANLNSTGVPWGYLSVVTNINANDVLSPEFVRDKREKGAILARYLEFLPVGPRAMVELIPSGEVYYLMEKRKREIINNGEIYMQDTSQEKCRGLLFFDVDGNIKNCPFFHCSKHNVSEGNILQLVKSTTKDWCSARYLGECPIYSDPQNFKNHLQDLEWKTTVPFEEEYLSNPDVAKLMADNYRTFLAIKAAKGL